LVLSSFYCAENPDTADTRAINQDTETCTEVSSGSPF